MFSPLALPINLKDIVQCLRKSPFRSSANKKEMTPPSFSHFTYFVSTSSLEEQELTFYLWFITRNSITLYKTM